MDANKTLTARSTWLLPVMLILGLAAALPAVYLSATIDPQGHLADLPVALVVEPQTHTNAASVAARVGDAVEAHSTEAIAFSRMTNAEFDDAMRNDRIAGGVVIPADFDESIATLFPGATSTTIPQVTIVTNAGDGGLSNGLLVGNLTPLLRGVADAAGKGLVESAGGGSGLAASHVALLSEPFHIVSEPYAPLAENTGLGTSAFYFSLVLVLIAFIGASLVGPLVDSALGFIPSEVGPRVIRKPYTAISRRRTFIAKAAVMLGAAPLAAFVLQWVTVSIGVAVPDPITLWLFSTAVIGAIGVSATTVFALYGPGVGSLISTFFFIAFAMVSSGGIVPLEAAPPFFRWLSAFLPFRHVIDGVRSLFYFDGSLEAGLGGAWVGIGIGGAAALVVGLILTTLFSRVPAFSRHPPAEEHGAPAPSGANPEPAKIA
jgi:ABC-type polysaccharide/polyol phosphate export permease